MKRSARFALVAVSFAAGIAILVILAATYLCWAAVTTTLRWGRKRFRVWLDYMKAEIDYEMLSREEAARLLLDLPEEEWRKGRVYELSAYRRVSRL